MGRLLDSEITAPLDSTPAGVVHPPAWRLPLCMAPQPAWRLLLCMAPPSAWRLPLYKAPSSMARALCKAPLPLAPALCKAPSPRHVRGGHFIRHTGLRVPSQPKAQGGNFLTKWRFQRNVAFSHLASRDARRRAPRVPFGTTQEEFSFVFDMQVLLPALLPIDRAPARALKFQITTTRKPDDGARRDFACTSS